MPALMALPEYDIAAVCTTKPETAEASKQKYEAGKAYTDFRKLVADPDIDVVAVCVRVPYHHEIVMAALDAGKHVYCEWPLAATVQQATEMAELAEKRGVHTMVGLQARGAPSIIHLRQRIADGWIGEIVSASLTQIGSGLLEERDPDGVWRGVKTNGANTMTIAFGHAIDAFCWCVGNFADVSGIVDTRAPEWLLKGGEKMKVTSPDHVSLTGRLENGAVATATVAVVPWHAPGMRMEIYGTEGTIVATANTMQATGVKLRGGRRNDKELSDIEIPTSLRWIPDEVPQGTPVNVAQMMRRFAEGIRDGSPQQPTFADAVRNHKLLDAIERSSTTKQVVAIE
jgi:predicted dehydrogenase